MPDPRSFRWRNAKSERFKLKREAVNQQVDESSLLPTWKWKPPSNLEALEHAPLTS
jgi:hypothetical protein